MVEAVAGAWRVAFDKTGTLTEGAPVVTDVFGLAAPPFLSRSRRAPADSAEAVAAGAEITIAQGQPMSRRARPR